MMRTILLWVSLISTAIVGMIDDIEHKSNHHRLLIKLPLIAAFVIYRRKSPNFEWEFLALSVLFPIAEYLYLAQKGDVYGPPMFDHLLPGIIAFALLMVN